MTKMKDSGIEWIGQIPEDWSICKLKKIVNFEKGKNAALYTSEYIGKNTGNYPVYSGQTENDGIMGKINSYDYDIEQCLFTTTVGAKAMTVKFLKGKFSLSQNCLVMLKKSESELKYIFYNLMSLFDYEKSLIPSYMQPSLRIEDLKKYEIIFPTLLEQQKIADFLDKKCGEIDRLIEIQEQEIEKLKEYKTSVITKAVTKGLEENRVTKKSQIEWLEKIPEEWNEIKLKYCSYIRARLGWKGLKAEEYIEKGYPLLSAFNIKNDKLDMTDVNFINQFRYDESPEIKLQVNDIILVKDGAGIGKCAVIDKLEYPSTTNGSLAVITVQNHIVSKFLYYFFLSKIFQKYIDRLKDGMGVPHLFQSDLREIKIPCPSIKEQQNIISFLDEKCLEIGNLIKKKNIKIEKLQEYKKSLIYEYVTGKKEVV